MPMNMWVSKLFLWMMEAVPTGFRRILSDFCSLKLLFLHLLFSKFSAFLIVLQWKYTMDNILNNIVITFLTSRTIVGLQTNIWGHQCHYVLQKVAAAPDSKALTLIAQVHFGDVYLMSTFTHVHICIYAMQYVSKTFPVRWQIDIY